MATTAGVETEEEVAAMRSIDLPLLLASKVAGQQQETFPLDRVRMQKAVFLAIKRGYPSWADLYTYKPYDWGPYSRQLAGDVEGLVSSRLLKIEASTGSRYGRYTTTSAGEDAASRIWHGLPEGERAFLQTVRRYVTSKSFSHLLREVYAEYPDYATASRFSG